MYETTFDAQKYKNYLTEQFFVGPSGPIVLDRLGKALKKYGGVIAGSSVMFPWRVDKDKWNKVSDIDIYIPAKNAIDFLPALDNIYSWRKSSCL